MFVIVSGIIWEKKVCILCLPVITYHVVRKIVLFNVEIWQLEVFCLLISANEYFLSQRFVSERRKKSCGSQQQLGMNMVKESKLCQERLRWERLLVMELS